MLNHLLYVDPGSGSYLVQLIITAILGAVFYFKNGWAYLKSIFRKDKKNESS
jgi:hypothetical protein